MRNLIIFLMTSIIFQSTVFANGELDRLKGATIRCDVVNASRISKIEGDVSVENGSITSSNIKGRKCFRLSIEGEKTIGKDCFRLDASFAEFDGRKLDLQSDEYNDQLKIDFETGLGSRKLHYYTCRYNDIFCKKTSESVKMNNCTIEY